MKEKYSKILVGKYSPENKCYINEDEPLCIKSLKTVPIKMFINLKFMSLIDYNKFSKFGWVKETEIFTFDDFVNKYLKNKKLAQHQIAALAIMLDSIDKLEPGTPVAANYNCWGVIEKKMVLRVHKVFFYPK